MNSFPYTANDRLYGSPLALDLSSNPGATPPHSAHGNSTLGKLWLDTSVGPPQLRVCAVAQAQAAYVASDWFNFGPVTGGGSSALTYMPLAGDSTKAGSLVISTNLTVGGFTSLSGISAINLTLNGGGVNGHTFNPWGITYPSFLGGHAIGFDWDGANLVAHVDGTANPGALATVSQLGGYLLLAGGTITGGLTINGGSTALYVPNGNIATNGTLTVAQTGYFGGDVTINGGGTALSVPNGNVTTNGSLTVGGTGYFGGDVTIHGGGAAALNVDNGGINAQIATLYGGGSAVLNVPNGGITSAGGFVGPALLGGADGNAGTLRMYNAENLITFRWDGINVFYRVDGAVQERLAWAQGVQGIVAVSDGGSPTGMSISFQASPGTGYALHVDQISDARLKDNIRPTEIDALAALIQIPVRAFEWNEAAYGYMPDLQDAPIGLVAQEVQAFAPYTVGVTTLSEDSKSGLPNDVHRVIHEHMTPYLVRAIQQLEARVKILEGA